MQDYLGNHVEKGDTVIIAMRSGRSATISRGYIVSTALKPQFAGGIPTNMVEVEWSNIHKLWMPARHVVRIPNDMLPEKRKERLNDVEEGVQVSEL